jgi:hypothetical protein
MVAPARDFFRFRSGVPQEECPAKQFIDKLTFWKAKFECKLHECGPNRRHAFPQ